MKLRPKSKQKHPEVLQVIHEIQQVYKKTLPVLLTSKADLSRILYLRPSQLPFCPVNFFVINASQGPLRIMDMESDFYTSVGTAVHTTAQKYLSHSGKFLASWRCKQCGNKREVSMDSQCCDFTMEYHEIKINYKGVVGHIDAVYKDRVGRYWILDFKTTSSSAAKSKANKPGAAYTEQIETYALYLWREHKIKVHGVLLMFIRRDNLKEPAMYGHIMTDIKYKKIADRIKKYKKLHAHVLDITTKKEALALLDYGKCKNPFCETCTDWRDSKLKVEQAYQRGKRLGYLPLRALASK